jgi:RNA 2',3'-cyclic 3'-phosphodiesterase
MPRLFVAIRPPAFVRARLLSVMGGIAGARWQSDEQLHLTLCFIGEVDRHRARDAHAALGAIHHPPFEIALDGVHAFQRQGAPVSLWAGVRPHDPLAALHKKVVQALGRAGIAPEAGGSRAFLPHITLARLPRAAAAVGPFLAAAGGVAGPTFEVVDFRLFESRLTSEGADYAAIERYSLG